MNLTKKDETPPVRLYNVNLLKSSALFLGETRSKSQELFHERNRPVSVLGWILHYKLIFSPTPLTFKETVKEWFKQWLFLQNSIVKLSHQT